MSVSPVELLRAGVEIVPISDMDDIERTLLEMWPDKRIPAHEFQAMLDPLDISILKYHVGCERTFYGIREIAELIWKLSNYEQSREF
ncbi:hypothetical protein [Vibrio sp. Sgm 5]|uniref:hypothetical protein n=1 Tax=Vibrio sp. Sgm 5 TaxID=2994387 RepID=UPI00224930B9|nr:hypothetical protein [Vibrio sp. Sgm 5]MCX2788367.1 hypothetical protein [Vibrio sp. Sgm 5]